MLGAWDVSKAIRMTEHASNEWVVGLDASQLPSNGFEFKFIVTGTKGTDMLWEEGSNRVLEIPGLEDGDVVEYELAQAYFAIAPWRGAGVVVPIFSLRSEGSYGVGDFGDLKRFVDWASKTEQRVIQVLPINDTNMTQTWQDNYPYCIISIYALHP